MQGLRTGLFADCEEARFCVDDAQGVEKSGSLPTPEQEVSF
jgi:hypothetical protein